MICRTLLTAALLLPSLHANDAALAQAGAQPAIAAGDWAWWRGPNRNGVAADQDAPLEWSEDKNIVWKVPVPGRGYASPIVVGDRIYLATADEAAEVQSVLCYDRKTGEQRWKTDVHHGGFVFEGKQGHVRSSKASSTVACDGERVFAPFINDNAVFLTALSIDGEQLWQKKICDYVMHQGYGASPAIYGPLVIVSVDHHGGGVISAYDRASGNLAWSHKRPENPNYASPIIQRIGGEDQVVLVGCDRVASYEPLTGAVNWDVEGATTECVTSTVSDGKVVATSGGYPSRHISVLRGDGSGEVLWRNETMVYVPSLLLHGEHLYVVTDNGEAICYELKSGKVAWEHRLRGKFAASPILVGENIYATSHDGVTYVYKASPAGFELVAENVLDADEVQATPAICGGQVFMRVARGKGDERKELLYCIGSEL